MQEFFIFAASSICANCADIITNELEQNTKPDDLILFDNLERFPDGPFNISDNEVNSPCHCDRCGQVIPFPLSDDGKEFINDAIENGETENDILEQWLEVYETEFNQVTN